MARSLLLTVPLFLGACMAQPGAPNPNFTPQGPATPLPSGALTVCDLAQTVFLPKCNGCHQAGGQSPDLSLAGARLLPGASARSGVPLVVAGDRQASLLYRKVSATHGSTEGLAMPPGIPLSAELVEGMGRWIDGGASVECTLTGPLPTPERHHPAGWADPGQHGLELKLRISEADCRNCHGAELTGNLGPSCDSCHAEGWRRNCTFCHGGTDDNSGAPPRDLSGELVDLTFRAHSAHRASTKHPSFDCTQCHDKPTEATSPNHVFDDTPGRAEVRFQGGQSPAGTYLGNGRCANLYCHGDGQGGLGTADHNAPPVCGSCHAGPSSPPSEYGRMSGAHERHLDKDVGCDNCHAGTVLGATVIGPQLHVNGRKDVVFAAGLTMVRSATGCNGSCHGEQHQDANWFER